MVEIRSMEQINKNWVRGCLRSYLEGKQELNYIKGVIRSGALQPKVLQEIFNDFRSYENLPRYQEILKECQKEGWI